MNGFRPLFPSLILCAAVVPFLSARADEAALAARVDRAIAARLATAGVSPAPPADDAAFLRRATLDLTGRIPKVSDVRAFLADAAPDKRSRLIDRLLADPRHAAHFARVWRQLLVAPTANPAAATAELEEWLKGQFRDNVPHDRTVRALLTARATRPAGGSLGPFAYLQAAELKPELIAANAARHFLGVRLECAQCHDHPFATWKREQFWSFAAFFTDIGTDARRPAQDVAKITIAETKTVVAARHLDGREPRWREGDRPRDAAADWLTSADNRGFARASANRLWAHLFGHGLVDPPDDFGDDNHPSHPELLDDLARSFADSGFDRRALLRSLLLSATYQRASAAAGGDARLYGRMPVKRLSADQLFDSLAVATGFVETTAGREGPREPFRARFGGGGRPVEPQASVLQALTLMNGPFLAEATDPKKGKTLAAVVAAPFLDAAGKIETLYLAALGRPPRPEEQKRALDFVAGGGAEAWGDLFWALLNSGEFSVNS